MTLWYANQTHTFELLKVDDLPFLILLGRDAPGFTTLLRMAMQEVAVVDKELCEAEEGPEPTNDGDQIQTTWALNPSSCKPRRPTTTWSKCGTTGW